MRFKVFSKKLGKIFPVDADINHKPETFALHFYKDYWELVMYNYPRRDPVEFFIADNKSGYLMESINQFDKNSNEIYIGDILKVKYQYYNKNKYVNCEVVKSNGNITIYPNPFKSSNVFSKVNDMEIIGNKYTNPDQLK